MRETSRVIERPTGTVTFLFTDIVGSTRWWQVEPAAMDVALVRHDRVLRHAIGARRGVVFSTAGDAFAAAFWTPTDAVQAAVAAQAALAAEGGTRAVALQVRMGIHTGIASERDDDYFGPTVNRAARIMAAGHGGQVLVSDATAKLLGGEELLELGEYRLKDIDEPERVWQVGGRDFPPLRAQRARVGNLRAAARSFVGRVDDCKRLIADLKPGRVVTLTGVGGVGKTRMALEVAHALSREYSDGVWWCDLTPIEDPAGCAAAVASTLSAVPQPEMSAIEAVVDTLFGRRVLLVVDNCEHVLAAAAEMIAAIEEGCPTVAALATSREPLGISTERVWPLRPLDPDLEGVELFLERASAADATFSPGDERPALVELWRRLDGIPLAIELAAARVRSMTPLELFARLDDRLQVLRGQPRDGVARHQTLATTLDWSYTLLTAAEQTLLDRGSVFAGTFDLEAVEAICAGGPGMRPGVVDLLANLVDKSLVVAERTEAGTRYRLLETVRQYAAGHAADRGETTELRDRHLAHFIAVAEAAFADLLVDYTSGTVVFEREWDNLRAATQHALSNRDAGSLDRLFAAIQWHALYKLRFEVADWADEAATVAGVGASTFGASAFLRGVPRRGRPRGPVGAGGDRGRR